MWTAPKIRDPTAADRWTWLIIAAHAQLRLARTLAEDLRLPWQRPGAPPTFRTADPLGSLTGKDGKLAGKYKTYSSEFKEEAAKLVINASRPIADVARELKISETSLGNWVRAWREKHAEDEPPLQVSERARLRELERLNRELEMENAFLKKAAAYFAREHR